MFAANLKPQQTTMLICSTMQVISLFHGHVTVQR